MLKKKEEQTTGKNIGKNMCKIEQKLQRKHLIALSFFLPLLVMAGCCIVFGVQPFGDNSLLIIDGLHQYMPFYSVLYDKLKGCLLYTSPSPRDGATSRMPSSA